ncbi:MAG: twin-arginine translocation signal domain-containing protein, partial [Planctomycetota bacterium]
MKRRKFIKLAAAAAGWATSTGTAGLKTSQAQNGGPKSGSSASHIEWCRKVPVRYEADVAVIGGG